MLCFKQEKEPFKLGGKIIFSLYNNSEKGKQHPSHLLKKWLDQWKNTGFYFSFKIHLCQLYHVVSFTLSANHNLLCLFF